MNQSLQSAATLFQILLVEDDRDLNSDLQILIRNKLPGIEIASAETVTEATVFLSNDELHFSLAILDIRVPKDRGFNPEASPEISNRLKQKGIAALCMTGFKGSPDVDAFLKNRALEDPPVAVIEKNLSGKFVDELILRVRVWLTGIASRNIRQMLDQTFDESPQRPAPGFGTAELMSLQQAIIDYWTYISPEIRVELRERFEIRECDGVVTSLRLNLGEI